MFSMMLPIVPYVQDLGSGIRDPPEGPRHPKEEPCLCHVNLEVLL